MKSDRNRAQNQVPLSKQTKRKQREHHALSRRDWGAHNPATKQMPNAKAYNRKKIQTMARSRAGFGFFCCSELA